MEFAEVADRFDRYFASEGGLFDPYTQSAPYAADYSLYVDFLAEFIMLQRDAIMDKSDKDFKLFWSYIRNNDINAVAAKDREVYYIGINAGVVYLLERLFSTMLANPNNITAFGNASSEVATELVKNCLYSSVDDLVNSGNSLDYEKPKDSTRLNLAKFLTGWALGFLAMHEFTHIVDGHVDYINSKYGIRLLQENGISPEMQAAYMFRQTIEFDADSCAIKRMLDFAFYYNAHPEQLPEDFRPFVKDLKSIVALNALAIYTIFRIFGKDYKSDKPMLEQYYPPFDVRRRMISTAIATLLVYKETKGDLTTEQVDEIIRETNLYLLDAEVAFAQRNIAQPVPRNEILHLNSILTEVVIDHINAIKDAWEEVQPKLVPFAHCTLQSAKQDRIRKHAGNMAAQATQWVSFKP